MNRYTNRVELIGCTASGKTTLCKTMQKLGWNAIYEPYMQNPFLTSFFQGYDCAFEVQMCFLLQHYNKIKSCANLDSQSICDFSLSLDDIYATILLNEKEKSIYNELLAHIRYVIGYPRYIIKIECPDATILNRISIRGRAYEKSVDVNFIQELNDRINCFAIPNNFIVVDSSLINFSNENEVYNEIIKKMDR
ncbi:MAG: deoxynucleoside kinase [Clostridia bacterium]|nr:deoxynucleoside kinase [Clostridia bacterium]